MQKSHSVLSIWQVPTAGLTNTDLGPAIQSVSPKYKSKDSFGWFGLSDYPYWKLNAQHWSWIDNNYNTDYDLVSTLHFPLLHHLQHLTQNPPHPLQCEQYFVPGTVVFLCHFAQKELSMVTAFLLTSTHHIPNNHYAMRAWNNDDHLIFFKTKLA